MENRQDPETSCGTRRFCDRFPIKIILAPVRQVEVARFVAGTQFQESVLGLEIPEDPLHRLVDLLVYSKLKVPTHLF